MNEMNTFVYWRERTRREYRKSW